MRNFKKILSLVLALAMMLSVMVVGAGAAFSDEADFSDEYVTAAEVLTNLGVLKGYEDGSFQPKDTITRAETAALIYRMATGDVADAKTDIYTQMTNGFTDVPNGKWFAGYINFCANSQYILGMGDGTFGPQKNVTGYQTLAMILRAAGFDKDGEFAGPGWETKTASFAEKLGVLENVKGTEDLGAPATRELVAELLFAVMSKVDLVHYAPFWGYTSLGETLGEKEFDLVKVEGVVWANEEANLGTGDSLKAGETQIFTNTVSDPYELSTGLDIIGEQVTFWAADDVALCTPISKADTTTEWSNTTYNYLSDKDMEACDEDFLGHTVYYNYDLANQAAKNLMGKGVYVKVIDNPDATDYVMVEKMSLSTVNYIDNDGDVKLDCKSAEIDAEDVVYTGIAKDDVVLYIDIDGTTFIEKAPYITGYITKVNHYAKADDTATIGGEAYAESTIAPCNDADVHDFNLTKNAESTYDKTYNDKVYNYYQDAYGNIVAWAFASENDFGYALILRYDEVVVESPFAQDELWVEYLTADGSVEQAVIDTDEGAFFATPDQKAAGKVVNFRIDDEGEFVVVYPCDDVADTTMTVDADEELAFTKTLKTPAQWNPVIWGPQWPGYWTEAEYTSAKFDADNVVAFYYDVINGKAVYGVKTGADALADLEGREVELAQWDKTDATTYDQIGELMMVNIDGIYAADKQYAYITSDDYDHEITADGNVYTFAAVNADGEEIMLKTEMPHMGGTFDLPAEGDVVEYVQYKLNVVGKGAVEANWIVEVLDGADLRVVEGELYAFSDNDLSKFVVVNENGSFTLKATAKFVNVSGTAGDIVLERDDAHEGIVIFEDGEALAVFVEVLEDGVPDLLP